MTARNSSSSPPGERGGARTQDLCTSLAHSLQVTHVLNDLHRPAAADVDALVNVP